VFVDELGVEYHPQRPRVLFGRACSQADVPAIRLHDLRHTMATLALTAGIHRNVVQEMLGHSGISVKLDIYSHVPQAAQRDAADRVASLFVARP
jgi:integrase